MLIIFYRCQFGSWSEENVCKMFHASFYVCRMSGLRPETLRWRHFQALTSPCSCLVFDSWCLWNVNSTRLLVSENSPTRTVSWVQFYVFNGHFPPVISSAMKSAYDSSFLSYAVLFVRGITCVVVVVVVILVQNPSKSFFQFQNLASALELQEKYHRNVTSTVERTYQMKCLWWHIMEWDENWKILVQNFDNS